MASKTDLRVVLGVDGEAKFSKTMKEIAEQQRLIKAETKNATSALSENATEYEKNSVKAESLTKQIALQEEKVKTLKEAVEKSSKATGENSSVTVDLKRKYEDAQASLNNMKKSLEDTNKKMQDANDKAKQAAKQLEDFGNKAQSAGDKAVNAGNKMSKYLSAGILAAGAFAAKEAIEYEDAFAGVTKTVDATERQLSELSDEILDMSTRLPESANDIAAVAEAAGQLGIKVEDISSFTEVMVGLGISTNLSADEAASALAKFANITKMSAEDYDRLGATIVDLGNNFATTEADIVEMATRLASTGTITGKTEPQMLAIATALSSVGIEAEAGGSAISKLMKIMEVAVQSYDSSNSIIEKTGKSLRDLELMASNNSSGFKDLAASLGLTKTELKTAMENVKQLNQFAQVSGQSADEFIKAYGVDSVKALGSFIDGLQDTERTGGNAVTMLQDMGLTEIRLSNAILALSASGGILTETVDTANAAWEENAALQTEVGKRTETTGSKMKMAKNELVKTAVKLGDSFLPTIADIAESVGELAESFDSLDDETKETIVRFALIVAAIGPVTTTIGKLTKGVGEVSKGISGVIKVTKSIKAGTYTGPLKNVITVLSQASSATGTLTTTSSSLAGVIGASGPLIAGFVAAAAAAAALYAGYYKLTEGDRALTESIEQMCQSFGKWDAAVESGTNLLSGLNTEIFVSSESAQKISEQVDAVQTDITSIATIAAQERRRLTDAEIKRLEELFAKMNELTNQELEFQTAYQNATITIAQNTTNYSKENAANLIATATETKDATIQLAEEQLNEKIMLLQQAYEVEGTMTEEEFQKKVDAAQAEYDLAVQSATDKFARVNEIVTQGYFEQNIQGNEQLQKVFELNNQLEQNEKDHEIRMSQIAADGNLDETAKNAQMLYENLKYYIERNRINKNLAASLDELNSDELAAWIEMSANTEYYKGKITDENVEFLEDFISIYDNLPRKAKSKFKDAMQGMLDGIEEKEPELYKKADDLGDGFLARLKRKFKSSSPSKVMRRLWKDDIIGAAVLGVEDEKEKLFGEAENLATGFLSPLQGLNADFEVRMQGALDKLMSSNILGQLATAQRSAAILAEGGRSVINNYDTSNTKNIDRSQSTAMHFDALFRVENMTVRSEEDLRELSNRLETLTKSIMRGKGVRG